MAKRNTKQGLRPPKSAQPKRRAPAGKSTSRSARDSSARTYKRSEQSAPRVSTRASLLTVRIVAIVIVLAAAVGGTAWAISLKGDYGAAQVAGLLALGFLTGLGLAVAIRTEQIVAQVGKILRDRR